MPVRQLPDAERLVGNYLRGHADVSVIVGNGVSTELPADPDYPWLTLSRVGGVPSLAGYLDAARIEFTCWAETKAEAHALARTVEAAMLDLPGSHALGVVTDVRQEGLGVRWNPDEITNVPRYQLIYDVFIHPA